MGKVKRRASAERVADVNRILTKVRVLGEGGEVRAALANLAESPLGWLMRRELITRRQFEAGERLRGDFMAAGLSPSVTMRWDPAAVPGRFKSGPADPVDPTTAQIAAKRRFEAATAAAGSGLADMLWRVVCQGDGLSTAEAALGWPARSGKVVLTIALDRLADFYNIK